jgi:hypothetical protein
MAGGESTMNSAIKVLLVLATVMQAASALAQAPMAPKAGVTLTISQNRPDGALPKNTQTIIVRETNISKGVIRESACTAFGVLYRLDVVYNGIPQEEPDEGRKRREAAEAVKAGKPAICEGSNPGKATKPGESWDDTLYYQAKQPGTYEFTVEEKSFPASGGEGVTVKSNTITVVVPAASADKPATHN